MHEHKHGLDVAVYATEDQALTAMIETMREQKARYWHDAKTDVGRDIDKLLAVGLGRQAAVFWRELTGYSESIGVTENPVIDDRTGVELLADLVCDDDSEEKGHT